MKTPLEKMEEFTAALEEALGIRTHVDLSDPDNPKMWMGKQPRNKGKLKQLLKTKHGRDAVNRLPKDTRDALNAD